MTSETDRTELQAGREALARGAWEEAKAAFDTALVYEETAEALEGLGLAAWWLDRSSEMFDARERAYTLNRAHGDRDDASDVCVGHIGSHRVHKNQQQHLTTAAPDSA